MPNVKPFRELSIDEQLARLELVAEALVPRYWSSPVEKALLQYENNAVYRAITTAGEQFVLRIATTWGRSEQEQRSEMQWLNTLRSASSVVVPQPVYNLDGDLVTVILPEGTTDTHACAVLGWLPGTPPETGIAPTLLERLGAIAAEMHCVAERFAPYAHFVRPHWDWERLFGAHSILRDENAVRMLTREQLATLQVAGEQLRDAFSNSETQALKQGLVQGDLHFDNILIDRSEVSVIDFDDCGWGYYLYDVASVLESFQRRIFATPEEKREGKEALLRGYASVRSLPPDVDKYLNFFMSFRAMVTLDFILRSKNANVQHWGLPGVGSLIDRVRAYLEGTPPLDDE